MIGHLHKIYSIRVRYCVDADVARRGARCMHTWVFVTFIPSAVLLRVALGSRVASGSLSRNAPRYHGPHALPHRPQLSPKYVVSGSLDMTIRVWDLESGKCHSVLKGHQSLTGTLFIRDDILVSANADKSLRLWNLNTGTCTHCLEGHQGAVTDIGVTSKYIVSCSDDGTAAFGLIRFACVARLLLLPSRSLLGVWRALPRRRTLVDADATRWRCFGGDFRDCDPSHLAGTVRLWNFLTGEFIRTLVDINSSYPELNK